MKLYHRLLLFLVPFFVCANEIPSTKVYPTLSIREHLADARELLGAGNVSDDIFTTVTKFMDTEAKQAFKNVFPEAKVGLGGDHRIMGHVLDGGSIPKDAVEKIMEKTGLPKQEVIRRLVEYNKKSLNKLVAELVAKYGMPERVAKALIRLDACIHLLGDWSTSATKELPSLKRIISCYERNLGKVIGNQKARAIAKQMRKVLAANKGASKEVVYRELKKVLSDAKVSKAVQQTIAKFVSEKSSSWVGIAKKIKKFIPKKVLERIGKSGAAKIAKATSRFISKWIKEVSKNPSTKKIGKFLKKCKPVAKALPYVADVGFWAWDMYGIYGEWKQGEITEAERNKKYTEGTGEAIGYGAGFVAGWKAADVGTEHMENLPPYAILGAKVLSGIAGAWAGGKAARAASGKSYDAIMGTPLWQCLNAATNGNAEAMFFMGKYYDDGRYVDKCYSSAFEWFQAAAAANHAKAHHVLGRCYMIGKGGEVNHRKAVAHFETAYANGFANAALPLAKAYFEGVGVSKSTETALAFLKNAVDNNIKGAQDYAEEILASVYEAVQNTEEDLSSGDLRILAEFFSLGLVVEKSELMAFDLYSKSADEGDVLALCKLGDIAYSANDIDGAIFYYTTAAEDGLAEAQLKLSCLLSSKRGSENTSADDVPWWLSVASDGQWKEYSRDFARSDAFHVVWLRQCADQGSNEAEIILARMSLGGYGNLPRNTKEAFSRFKKVAETGDVTGQRRLGRMFLRGNGVEKDLDTAERYLNSAIEAGDAKAYFWRGLVKLERGDSEAYIADLKHCLKGNEDATGGEFTMAKHYLGKYLINDEDRACREEGIRLLEQSSEEGDESALAVLCAFRAHEGYTNGLETVVGWISLAAELNDVWALRLLGDFYRDGIGVDKDLEKALSAYRQSAELGNAEAQAAYADMIESQDVEKAKEWFQIAAEKKNGYACLKTGNFYLEEKKYNQAFKFYSIGADAGDIACWERKGYCMSNGYGIKKDKSAAWKCYEIVREMQEKNELPDLINEYKKNFDAAISENFSVISERHSGDFYVAPNYDNDKLKNAKNAMNTFDADDKILVQYDSTLLGGAKEGFLITRDGIYFCNGTPLYCSWKDVQLVEVSDEFHIHIRGRCKHTTTGERYRGGYIDTLLNDESGLCKQSIVNNLNAIAISRGGCHELSAKYTIGVDAQNVSESHEYSKRHCDKVKSERQLAEVEMDADACYNMGIAYYTGDGQDLNLSEAVKWFRKASDLGNVSAQFNLGVCYENGYGVEKNSMEAVRWYRKAADKGHVGSLFNLGLCYEYGRGVNEDHAEAIKWLRNAAQQGDKDAQNALRELNESW